MLKSYFAFLIDAGVISVTTALYFVLFVVNSFSAENLDFYTSLFSVIYFALALGHQLYSYSKLNLKKMNLKSSDFLTQVTCCFVFLCYSVAPVLNLFDNKHEAFEGLSSLWLLFAAISALRISFDELQIAENKNESVISHLSNDHQEAA